eukprot:SAG11_NODE_429_length_9534_cov_14.689242_5_plen_91_part_00
MLDIDKAIDKEINRIPLDALVEFRRELTTETFIHGVSWLEACVQLGTEITGQKIAMASRKTGFLFVLIGTLIRFYLFNVMYISVAMHFVS